MAHHLIGLDRAWLSDPQVVMDICREHGIPLVERNLSLVEVHTAEECFTTGTMGELSPVVEVDGRLIGGKKGTAR